MSNGWEAGPKFSNQTLSHLTIVPEPQVQASEPKKAGKKRGNADRVIHPPPLERVVEFRGLME